MTEALTHASLAATKVNETLGVLQAESVRQIKELYDILSEEFRDGVGNAVEDRKLQRDFNRIEARKE